MKKIPTLFERVYENNRVVGITNKVTPGFEWVLEGEGVATVKFDGSCCAIIDGEFYKRFDAKKGRKIPEGAIPCCNPDSVTGHWPHWVKVNPDDPGDKWFMEAYNNTLNDTIYLDEFIDDDIYTFEAVGPHFQGNPYNIKFDCLARHGKDIVTDNLCTDTTFNKRTFEHIKNYLKEHDFEGIVFWKDGEPQCKIKRSDFGFEWPVKERVM